MDDLRVHARGGSFYRGSTSTPNRRLPLRVFTPGDTNTARVSVNYSMNMDTKGFSRTKAASKTMQAKDGLQRLELAGVIGLNGRWIMFMIAR
eukprot:1334339-Amorphochlora_amoeboformis.AAC.1